MKLFYKFTILFSFIILTSISCQKNNDDEPMDELKPSSPDNEGNLVIINHSGSVLALCRNGEVLKVIPNSSEDFLVKIPNDNKIALDLEIYRIVNGVKSEELYKQWTIALSQDCEIEHRATWFIRNDSDEIYSGTLVFNYVGGTDYQVDIYLNNTNGAKLITLKPGDQYENRVGIDYANYTALYRYWFSDPNNANEPMEIGWVDKEIRNDNKVDIFVVLNQNNPKRTMQIPHYNGNSVNEGSIVYGNLRVKNDNSEGKPIQLWVGDDLLEDYLGSGPQGQNSSTIGFGDISSYEIQVGEYIFTARDIQTTGIIETLDTIIVKNTEVFWRIQ